MNTRYLKYKLFTGFTSPVFYICALVLSLFCAINVFFVQKFFGGAGTTNLYTFFSGISTISIVLIPLLGFKDSASFEEYLPYGNFFKLISRLLSQWIEYAVLLGILLTIPMCINLFGDVDVGQCFTGFLGILLFGLATLSFCLFVQAFDFSPVVSLFIELICLSVTGLVHLMLLYFSSVPALLVLAKTISFSWHFDSFGKGILDTRHILYFLITAAVMLVSSFAVTEYKMGRNLWQKDKKVICYAALIAVFAYLNSNVYYLRRDISSNHRTTVSKFSKQLAENLEEKLNITYYRSNLLSSLYPQVRDISDYLSEYAYNKNVTYVEIDPARNKLENVLAQNGIYGRQIQTVGTNKTEYVNVYSSIVLEYCGKKEIIPFILAGNSLEYDLDTRILHLLSGKDRIVNVLCGNGMSLKNDYSYVTPWLNSQNFIVNEISLDYDLEKQLSYSDSLILFGSDMLNEEQCEKLFDYILAGNKALLTVSPFCIDIENAWHITWAENDSFLRKLERLGIGFGKNLMADVSCTRITMETEQNQDGSASNSTYSQSINYPYWINLLAQKNSPQGITLFWPAEITALGDDFEVYLSTSNSSWYVEPDNFSAENLFQTNPFEVSKQKIPANTNNNTAALVNKNHSIVVIPDQFFANSLMLGYSGGKFGDYRNLDFIVSEVLKMNKEVELAKIHEKSTLSGNTSLYKVYDEESFISAKNRTQFCCFILNPFIVAACWIAIVILRKKEKLLKW